MLNSFIHGFINDYSKRLVPNLKKLRYSSEYSDFYWDTKIDNYPTILFQTKIQDNNLTERYDIDEEEPHIPDVSKPVTKTYRMWPNVTMFECIVYVENYAEAINLRNRIRQFTSVDPYVQCKYFDSEDGNNVTIEQEVEVITPIGIRITNLSVISERPNFNDKGARRAVKIEFVASIVLISGKDVELIDDVVVNFY